MKIGLNLAIVEHHKSYKDVKEISSFCLSDGLEFPIQSLIINKVDLKYVKGIQVFGNSGTMHKTEIFPESVFISESQFRKQLELLDQKLVVAKSINSRSLSLGIDPWVSKSLSNPRKIFIERVSKIAEKVMQNGMELHLEFISHMVNFPSAETIEDYRIFCSSLENALGLIYEINCKNVKLLLDILHWHADSSSLALEAFISDVGHVHLCDYMQTSSKYFNDSKRVLPFEGSLPVKAFLEQLIRVKYKRGATIEVFRSPEYAPSLVAIRNSISKCRFYTSQFENEMNKDLLSEGVK